jgi:DNA-binding NtrC family response regulator
MPTHPPAPATHANPTILLIDDHPQVLAALALLFALEGYHTISASQPEAALRAFSTNRIDLVVQDMNFGTAADHTSGQDGMTLFHALRAQAPTVPIVLLTAWTHLEQAVALVKAGAADYLGKPWNDQKLRDCVSALLAAKPGSQHSMASTAQLPAALDALDLRGGLFVSSAMQALVRLAARVAVSDVAVLITGPNGAGKERIAEIVHYNSTVKSGPLIVLNCGALPAELLEAELFGAEAGAFTGAAKVREGRFEAAHGGTLFLDEIGNLSLSGQMKLLRVIETGRFERLGSTKTRHVTVRVISATNSDLPALIRAGQFREDLYYRLNVVALALPSLAQRRDDIVPLAQLFLGAAQGAQPRLSAAGTATLLAHDWPGNVRELRNVITPADLGFGSTVEDADILSRPLADAPQPAPEPTRAAIEAALERAGNVVSEAAESLGLSRQALYRRMQRFNIVRAEE